MRTAIAALLLTLGASGQQTQIYQVAPQCHATLTRGFQCFLDPRGFQPFLDPWLVVDGDWNGSQDSLKPKSTSFSIFYPPDGKESKWFAFSNPRQSVVMRGSTSRFGTAYEFNLKSRYEMRSGKMVTVRISYVVAIQRTQGKDMYTPFCDGTVTVSESPIAANRY